MSLGAVQKFIRGLGNSSWNEIGVWQEADVLVFMDTLYAVVERSERGFGIIHIPSGDFLPSEDFERIFAPCNYVELDFHTRKPVGNVNIGQLWLTNSNRHQVETIEDLRRES